MISLNTIVNRSTFTDSICKSFASIMTLIQKFTESQKAASEAEEKSLKMQMEMEEKRLDREEKMRKADREHEMRMMQMILQAFQPHQLPGCSMYLQSPNPEQQFQPH